jgi:hypothetical protein
MVQSWNEDPDRASRELRTIFFERDKLHRPGQPVQRRFKGTVHFLRNLLDLLTYTPDLVRVYLGRAISPRLRELIMLTVASANDCNF